MRTDSSGSWLSLINATVGRKGKVCRLSPGQRKQKKPKRENRAGQRRVKATWKRRGGREKVLGGLINEKMQEGAEGQEAQVYTRLCCPTFSTLDTALSQSSSLTGDGEGWCCAGFGKNSMAAPQGLLIKPCCVAPRHCASLHMHRSLRALPMGIRPQSHSVANGSNSSLSWAINNSV